MTGVKLLHYQLALLTSQLGNKSLDLNFSSF